MLRLYCRAHHGAGSPPCPDCARLGRYADRRLDLCPYGTDKPTCVNCPIHCYRPEPRERMRDVMRWAGPRMVWHHPLLALFHLIDGRRSAPDPPRRRPAHQDGEEAISSEAAAASSGRANQKP